MNNNDEVRAGGRKQGKTIMPLSLRPYAFLVKGFAQS